MATLRMLLGVWCQQSLSRWWVFRWRRNDADPCIPLQKVNHNHDQRARRVETMTESDELAFHQCYLISFVSKRHEMAEFLYQESDRRKCRSRMIQRTMREAHRTWALDTATKKASMSNAFFFSYSFPNVQQGRDSLSWLITNHWA